MRFRGRGPERTSAFNGSRSDSNLYSSRLLCAGAKWARTLGTEI